MTEPRDALTLDRFLAGAHVEDAVVGLRPDYRALLIAVDGLAPAADGQVLPVNENLLTGAEAHAADLLASAPVAEMPHVAAWREAYRAFGAKPQRTRNSLEALLRRATTGLPRVNQLTDVYNAVSVLHQVLLGGENLDAYVGAPRLVGATGTEAFDTIADGHEVVEHPEPGEVVWRDDHGVTCRRWNWRQGRRTQLTADTTAVLFVLDALAPVTDDALTAAGEELVAHLRHLGTDLRVATRLVTASTASSAAQELP